MSASQPEISIVIPLWNEEGTILPTLASLAERIGSLSFELIIVDNGSDDATDRICREYISRNDTLREHSRIISVVPRNRGIARNAGAREARGRYVAFFDSGVAFGSNFFETLISPLRAGMQAVQPSITYAGTSRGSTVLFNHLGFDFIDSKGVIYEREVFFKIGGFDYFLTRAEDIDLGWRFFLLGYHAVLVENATLFTPSGFEFISSIKRGFETGTALYRLHSKWKRFHQLSLKVILYRFILIGRRQVARSGALMSLKARAALMLDGFTTLTIYLLCYFSPK